MVPDELTPEQIAANAAKPQKASSDAGSVEQVPIPDQIAAADRLEANRAGSRRGFGLRFARITPGGTT